MVKQEKVPENQVIVVEEYTPKKPRTRSIETRSMVKKNLNKIGFEKPEEKEKQMPDKPTRSYKRKSSPVKTNGVQLGDDASDGDISPDSTSILRNQTTITAKRPRIQQTIEINDSDSDDELFAEDEPKQNAEVQFDSLFGGPLCFKGQVKPNANDLHKELLNHIKKEPSDHSTYTVDSDSD